MIVAIMDLKVEQIDIKTICLYGDLEQEIHMVQFEGFNEKDKEELVCLLSKSLYSLK